jgi:hypothetical protein
MLRGQKWCTPLFAWLLLMSPVPLFAQLDRGTITGIVTDPSGAVIVGANVTATNIATGVSTKTTTSSTGNYTIPLLKAGRYEVAVEQTGFKRFVQAGLILEVGQTLRVDASLQVGQTTQTVEVTAQAVQIQKDTSDRGTIVTGRDVLELPIVGVGEQRNPGYFMILAPGVTGRGVSYSGSPRMLNTTVNGSQSASNEFAVDGATIATASEWAGDFRNIPFPQDAVGEYKVMTLNPPAEYGRTGQGITSFTIKSGTNQFHGSAYEFVRNCTGTDPSAGGNSKFCLDSRGFFAAKAPINKQNEFGGTIGGPIRKDKTFFFGWYQGFRLRKESSSSLDTLPTAAMRAGDLSNTLGPQISICGAGGNQACFDALGRPVYQGEIYDPATQRVVAPGAVDPVTGITTSTINPANGQPMTSSWILRDAFGFNPRTGAPIPGSANVIPSNRIDPTSAKIFSYFPNPTLPGQRFGYINNWVIPNYSQNTTNQWGTKIDHTLTDNSRIMGEFMWLQNSNPTTGRWPMPIGDGSFSNTNQNVARFSHDWILQPNLVNHWTAGFNRWSSGYVSRAGLGWPATLGFAGVPQTGPGSVFPALNIGGLGNTYGNGGQGRDASNAFTFDESLTWTKGRHTIKTGFSYVKMQQNDFGYGLQSGYLGFNGGLTGLAGPWFNDSCSPGGQCTGMGAAGFLLGLGSTARAIVYAAGNADRMGQYAGYVQDDFKVTPRLTFNIGLRYDLILPTVSAHNQMSWMDPTATNPALGNARGAMVFASAGKRSPAATYPRAFGPRIGLAYSINDKTVLRTGYGILYTLGGASRSSRGCCYVQGWNSDNNVGEDGSTGYTGLLPSWGFQNAPLYNAALGTNLVNGFPSSRFPAPPFIDPSYALGGAPNPVFPGAGRPPMIQNWNFGIQRQLPGDILLDVAYVGTGGTHLVSRLMPTNQMPTQYLSLYKGLIFADIRDPEVQALPVVQSMPLSAIDGDIHVPFPGFTNVQGINYTLGQALRPFPQYTQQPNFQMRDLMEGVGVSTYHSLQVQARKHFSRGLTFLVSYTWSKTLTDAESIFNEFSGFTQDAYNRRAEKALSLNDYPHNLVISYEYQLPFGPGKKFANVGGPVGKVIGGWSIAGIQQYQSGRPNSVFTGANPYAPYVGPNSFLTRPNVVPGVPKKTAAASSGKFDPNRDAWLNWSAWADPAPFTLGNAPRTDGGVRMPKYLNEDISIIKRTTITERVVVEFRADFLNMFNRTVLGPDQGGDQYDSSLQGNNIDWGQGSFGKLTSQGNYPREIQFGLKLIF